MTIAVAEIEQTRGFVADIEKTMSMGAGENDEGLLFPQSLSQTKPDIFIQK